MQCTFHVAKPSHWDSEEAPLRLVGSKIVKFNSPRCISSVRPAQDETGAKTLDAIP